LLERVRIMFGDSAPTPEVADTLKAFHAKIGQLVMENDFLEGELDDLLSA